MKMIKLSQNVYELLVEEIKKHDLPVSDITMNSCIYNALLRK